MKIIELFAGVGCQTQALKNIGVDHKVVGISEIDKYAIDSYNQLHGETFNFGDISKIDVLPKVDMWTYSFPCQDISVAGYQKGIKKGTRSGLLSEVERLLEISEKPKYLLLENVKNLVSKKFKPDFDKWLEKLSDMGYTNYWKVMNAKDYGIPQNRERVFVVSILGEHEKFEFPEKIELKLRLKDILDDSVEEKYYLNKSWHFSENSTDRHDVNEIAQIEGTNYRAIRTITNTNKICRCLDTMGGGQREPKVLCLGNVNPSGKGMNGNVFDSENLSPTLTTNKGEGLKIGVKEMNEKKVLIAASRGRNPLNPSDRTRGIKTVQRLEINKNNISNSLTTVTKDNLVVERERFRVRKLTPKECWRLMGWKDVQFNKIEGISNSQLYKQAGNGIVINVLEKIFFNMFNGVEKNN